jgi:hypothetical protein
MMFPLFFCPVAPASTGRTANYILCRTLLLSSDTVAFPSQAVASRRAGQVRRGYLPPGFSEDSGQTYRQIEYPV